MEKQVIGNLPVGEKFYFKNLILQVIECGNCFGCYFRYRGCDGLFDSVNVLCVPSQRNDMKSVAFKLVGTIAPDGRIIPQKELPNP